MSLAFALSLALITALAFLGLPMGVSMITGSILYLIMRGQDLGISAEQLLNGMYTNYIMLAVPLFILAAEIMNSGSLSERLLNWCNAVVGRFRGGLAQVNILQSIVFAGMSGSAIADAAGSGKMMARTDCSIRGIGPGIRPQIRRATRAPRCARPGTRCYRSARPDRSLVARPSGTACSTRWTTT